MVTGIDFFCRSVHNIRVEQLWVDITAQIGASWANFFTILEIQHGLDINNADHIWLLHFLFLPYLNHDLEFFAEAWNEHKIQIRDGPNRSPIDMYTFDMLVYGVRGDNLGDMMSEEELEVYGIDWEALCEDHVRHSQLLNNPVEPVEEEGTSWISRSGPSSTLNEVRVDTPIPPPYEVALQEALYNHFGDFEATDELSRTQLWIVALAFAREMPGFHYRS